jgi:hypothetical protein
MEIASDKKKVVIKLIQWIAVAIESPAMEKLSLAEDSQEVHMA